jgi:alpha-L-arabinofuranosidase
MGHPLSFNLEMIGIGNEQWDEQYIERYKVFEKIFHDKYPSIKLVAAAGPSPDGGRFDYAWAEFKKLNPAFLDEHYYQPPKWFLDNAGRYDTYSRSGPKVFAGEFASHGFEAKESESKNTWISALSEAAFMTGLERNADVVQMASYAPLFAHVDAWQWRPDLIWFDNLTCVGTPNYYVQKMFSTNKGTSVVPILLNGQTLEGKDSVYASAVTDKNTNEVIIKMVNSSARPISYQVSLEGVKTLQKQVTIQMLFSNDQLAFNKVNDPHKIAPVIRSVDIDQGRLHLILEPQSLNVIKVPCKL